MSAQPGKLKADAEEVANALHDLGLRFDKRDVQIQKMMAFGMFDSRLSHKCAPAQCCCLTMLLTAMQGWNMPVEGRQ